MSIRLEACDYKDASGIGPIAGPILLVYMNNLDEKVIGMINKFADDTKVDSKDGFQKLEHHYDQLCKWAEKW